MTETTTQDRVDEENLVDAAHRAAEEAGAKSLATIQPTQQRFTEDQVAILRQLGIEDATDGDLNLFFHYCRTTGLDPFRKQIYMIGRNTKISEWVDQPSGGRTKVEKWVTKYTIQTGIDGYRRNGREAAKRLDDSLTFEGPFFTGEDDFHIDPESGQVIQHWREVWPKGKPPHAAKFVIHRNGEPFPAIAHYDEFVQTFGNNGEPNSMWSKMPRNQIAKCAEALAWRRAYPDDFAGLILEDSAQPTVIDQDGNVEREATQPKRRPGGSGLGGMRAAREERQRQRESTVVDGEVADSSANERGSAGESGHSRSDAAESDLAASDNASPADPPESGLRKSARDKLNGAIFATFGELKLNGDDRRADRLVVIREIVGRTVESSKELDDNDLQQLRNGLISRKQAGTLDADVTEWLNADELRREGLDPNGEQK